MKKFYLGIASVLVGATFTVLLIPISAEAATPLERAAVSFVIAHMTMVPQTLHSAMDVAQKLEPTFRINLNVTRNIGHDMTIMPGIFSPAPVKNIRIMLP